jgi:hypothetical protein
MLTEVSIDDGDIIVTLRLDPSQIAEQITFGNSDKVAYGLYHSNLEAAIALHAELDYHIKGPQSC